MVFYVVLGLLVGLVQALTGAGGILAVPLLVFVAQMDMAQAAPVSLLAVGMSAALGAVLGLRKSIVRYRAALLIAFVGMLLSPVGLWLAGRMDNRVLTILFALVLAFIAWRSVRKTSRPEAHDDSERPPCVRDAATGRFVWTAPCARALSVAGGMTGFLSGLLGVGGGFLMVPALRRWTDLPMESTVATSLAVIALVSASGVVSGLAVGRLDWIAAFPFCIGTLLGMAGGRRIASRLPDAHTQRVFAALVALVSAGMLVKALMAML
jgi:uncharacterized membrane protein YfcA